MAKKTNGDPVKGKKITQKIDFRVPRGENKMDFRVPRRSDMDVDTPRTTPIDRIQSKKLTKQPVGKAKQVKVSEKTMNALTAKASKSLETRQKAEAKKKQKEGMKNFARKSVAVGAAAIVGAQSLANRNKEKARQK
jgi:hypothetical protein